MMHKSSFNHLVFSDPGKMDFPAGLKTKPANDLPVEKDGGSCTCIQDHVQCFLIVQDRFQDDEIIVHPEGKANRVSRFYHFKASIPQQLKWDQ